MAQEAGDVAVGFDLGTTTSAVATVVDGSPKTILSETGRRTIPSIVAFTERGVLVGEEALQNFSEDPKNTIYEIKRLIGRNINDPALKADINIWPFDVQTDGTGRYKICVQNRATEYSIYPEQVSSIVLSELKKMAEDYLDQVVTKVVLTVPAAFRDAQRQATIDAAKMVGLQVLRIIKEPTAAALAFANDNALENIENRKVLVFDLGGGTFDVSILEMKNGEYNVMHTHGDTHLGGVDFDSRLMAHFQQKLITKHGSKAEITKDQPRATWRLRTACQEAKIRLSNEENTYVNLDGLFKGLRYNDIITREQFEKICEDLFQKIRKLTTDFLGTYRMSAASINKVLLVGGSTRMPKIKKLVEEIFGKNKVCETLNPDEAVCQGAALQAAAILNIPTKVGNDLVIKEILSCSLGIDLYKGQTDFILKKGSRIPCSAIRKYKTNFNKQTIIKINVVEGDNTQTDQNDILDEFSITGIPPMPAGMEKIEVTFEVTENNILSVKARSPSDDTITQERIVERSRKQFTEEDMAQHRRLVSQTDEAH